MLARLRLDQALVARGLAESRARAQAMIADGLVEVAGQIARKPALQIADQPIRIVGAVNPWVSRAALKLVHALDTFGLDPAGALCADVGASTGGFTEVLLHCGAARVIAFDVGHGQLHPTLVADPRVQNREGTNTRHLDSGTLPSFDWVVCDVSFISATLALPQVLGAARPGARLVTLVKPQFELDPASIGKGGIVRDATARARAVTRVGDWLTGQGWRIDGTCESPVTGSDGNVEFLTTARKSAPEPGTAPPD